MLDKLESMIEFHRQVLNVREKRQQILAINIANSDTPNYQARDISFNSELDKAIKQQSVMRSSAVTLTTTSAHHIVDRRGVFTEQDLLYRVPYQASADNNTVDMDQERVAMLDNSVRYQGSLTFLGEQFKSLMSVLQQG